MALRTPTTVDLFNPIMCEDAHESKFIEIALGWEPGHIWLHTTHEDPWPHYMMLEVCWDGFWTLSFGLSQLHGHGSRLVCDVWGRAWIEIQWNSIGLKARSHMTSHYTWGRVTTLHDVGGVFGRLLDTSFWALTISWSRLLAHVWSDPKIHLSKIIMDPSIGSHYFSSIQGSLPPPPPSLPVIESCPLRMIQSGGPYNPHVVEATRPTSH